MPPNLPLPNATVADQPPQSTREEPQPPIISPNTAPPPTAVSTPTTIMLAATTTTTTTTPPTLRAPVPNRPGEYLVLLANPRQPGVPGQVMRYPMAMNLNQSGILQASPALIRSINASQLIRAQTSGPGIGPSTPTSQASVTTMAGMPRVQIPIGATGARGQLTLPNGQTMMPSIPFQRHPAMTSRANILQSPGLIRGVAQQGVGIQPIISTSQPIGIGVPASMTQNSMMHQNTVMNSTATAPSQMTPDDALKKGCSFFNSLLTNASIKSKKTTLQSLIQSLIDGKRTSEEFAALLQKELNSPRPQTQLVPFLDLLLPHLRQSMNAGMINLPGIRAPGLQSSQLGIQSCQPGDDMASPSKVQAANSAAKKKKVIPAGQKSAPAKKDTKKKEGDFFDSNEDSKDPDRTKTEKRRQEKQKKQEKQLESLSSALRDDDDVNDVAAMGGVNLAEESQKIMASGAELVGTQIRSCKDEPFLDVNVLSARINKIVQKYNLAEPSMDVVTLVSHATQERLKTMVERLGALADHRSENLKFNPKYEVSNDVKGQVKFLAELDRIERRRNEEQEREQMLRIAKSRSKVEDPEQQKLRQKAKDMQRAEQEEVRQREANETALLAIGPRKKLKTSLSHSDSSFSQVNSLRDVKPNVDFRNDTVRRVRRVNMRDLQALLELDRTHLDRLIKLTVQ